VDEKLIFTKIKKDKKEDDDGVVWQNETGSQLLQSHNC